MEQEYLEEVYVLNNKIDDLDNSIAEMYADITEIADCLLDVLDVLSQMEELPFRSQLYGVFGRLSKLIKGK